jgi:prepilin peptidase CpaA
MAVLLALAVAPPLVAACLRDVRHRLIPDWTVAWIGAVGLGAALAGAAEAGAIAALAAPLAAGFACFLLGSLAARTGIWGWGDAKLIGAAGLLAGAGGILPLLLGTAVSGGLFALLMLGLRGPVRAGLLAVPAGAPRWLKAEQTRLRRHPTIPYAIPIAVGLLFALLEA